MYKCARSPNESKGDMYCQADGSLKWNEHLGKPLDARRRWVLNFQQVVLTVTCKLHLLQQQFY